MQSNHVTKDRVNTERVFVQYSDESSVRAFSIQIPRPQCIGIRTKLKYQKSESRRKEKEK